MTRRRDDGGLKAVRRVRSARERDSRIGLKRALATRRERERQAETALQRLDREPAFVAGTPDHFCAHRSMLTGLAEAHAQKRQRARAGATVAEEAQRHWQRDRTTLAAVELLLERREAERRAELARREARELDDIATQGWTRRQVARQADRDRVRRTGPASVRDGVPR